MEHKIYIIKLLSTFECIFMNQFLQIILRNVSWNEFLNSLRQKKLTFFMKTYQSTLLSIKCGLETFIKESKLQHKQ